MTLPAQRPLRIPVSCSTRAPCTAPRRDCHLYSGAVLLSTGPRPPCYVRRAEPISKLAERRLADRIHPRPSGDQVSDNGSPRVARDLAAGRARGRLRPRSYICGGQPSAGRSHKRDFASFSNREPGVTVGPCRLRKRPCLSSTSNVADIGRDEPIWATNYAARWDGRSPTKAATSLMPAPTRTALRRVWCLSQLFTYALSPVGP